MTPKESKRIKAANWFLNVEIIKKDELQDIVRLAAEICQAPTALIALIDSDYVSVKFKHGPELDTISRQEAFCKYAIEQDHLVVINDVWQDNGFNKNPLATRILNIRFYAGLPLVATDGHVLGSLCITDNVRRVLNNSQQQLLHILAKQIVNLLEFDSSPEVWNEQYIEHKNQEISLQSIFESSNSCHVLLNNHLEVVVFNSTFACYIQKLSNKRVKNNENVMDYIHEPYASAFLSNFNKALSGITVQIEREIAFPNETVWARCTYIPARNREGDINGVIFTGTNITKKVKWQQKAVVQSQNPEGMSYIQSSGLRKPVASIMGFMNIFKAEDYSATKEELLMLQKAVDELDEKIRLLYN